MGRGGFGVIRAADELGMDRSRVSRLSQELVDLGLLEKADAGALRVGRAFLSLAGTLNRTWTRAARVPLRRLASEFGVIARLSVRLDERVLLIRSEGSSGVDATDCPGMITPTWCTGAGRALLWDHSTAQLADLFADVEFIGVGGPDTVHSVDELVQRMERDRLRGVVDAREEFEQGVAELAAPIRDESGLVVAAIGVVGRVDDVVARHRRLVPALIAASVDLSNISS